jgi:hypothetical protein
MTTKWAAIAAMLAFQTTASAAVFTYRGIASGLFESTPNNSPAVGEGKISWHTEGWFGLYVWAHDLVGTVTSASVHCCDPLGAPVQDAPVVLNLPTFGGNSYNFFTIYGDGPPIPFTSEFLAANGGTYASARQAFFLGLDRVESYIQIRTTAFPQGEVRINLIPEPATFWLALPLVGIFIFHRRIKSSYSQR